MKRITKLLHTEYILWLLAGCLVAGRFIFYTAFNPNSSFKYFESFYFELLLGVLIALFPFIYFQIFGKYPLQSVKERDKEKKNNIIVHGHSNVINVPNDNNESHFHYSEKTGGIELFSQLVINAEDLANKIYKRSGVYLIFGVLIAFSGVLYFSFQSVATPSNTDLTSLLVSLLPRFGILFFIEFIAFFFLRQYRSAMNEFRHYDEIKRNRESQLALYIIAKKDFDEKEFSKVIDKMELFGKVGVLSKGQTTELIESTKLNENELNDIMEQILEIAKITKSKQTSKKSKST